jgi:hypothetical protein
MADVPQTLALLVLAQNYRGDIVNQINRRSTLLKTLRVVQGEGKNVAWVAKGSGQLAENYSEGADAANFGSDAQSEAVLSWGSYRSNFHITGRARRTARTSRTPLGIQNLVGRNMIDSIETLVNLINAALYIGPGTGTTIAGLDVAIGDDTNTYAAIDRTSVASWKPAIVADPGSPTPLTFQQIRSDLATIYDASGEIPDIAVCSSAVFDTVAGLFDSTRIYTQSINTARGLITLDAGYGAIEVNGCMFLRDKDAPAGTIYYINTRHTEIEYLPLDAMLMNQLMDMGMIMNGNDGYGEFPLGIWCEKLGKTGDSEKYQCLTELQLAVRRPNANGVRRNISTS